MPMSGSNYVAPTWVNNAPPALDAAELQAMCNTIVQNQGDAAALQAALQALTTTVNGKSNMQIVSYVGTGTNGASSPCSITADFPIKVAMYLGSLTASALWEPPRYYISRSNQNVVVSTISTSFKDHFGFANDEMSYSYCKKSSDGKQITWYNAQNSGYQINQSGYTYYFLCIG